MRASSKNIGGEKHTLMTVTAPITEWRRETGRWIAATHNGENITPPTLDPL
jgi:hypothetical protein